MHTERQRDLPTIVQSMFDHNPYDPFARERLFLAIVVGIVAYFLIPCLLKTVVCYNVAYPQWPVQADWSRSASRSGSVRANSLRAGYRANACCKAGFAFSSKICVA